MKPLGNQNLLEIDINPAGTASWKHVGPGVTNISDTNNDSITTQGYMDGDGGEESDVTGFQRRLAISAVRILGDDAQDYVFSLADLAGDDRHTDARYTQADGTVILGDSTICNIQSPSGAANAMGDCGFEIHFNGKYTKTDPVAATALDAAVTVGSAIGTTKFTAASGTGNTLAYRLSSVAVTMNNRQYAANIKPYTSTNNIYAAAGQYLAMYEIDAYNHVVKFLCEILEADDIKSA